jgi:hypothetical protein
MKTIINNRREGESMKRGQVTLFVLLAVVLVGVIIALVALPRLRGPGSESMQDPSAFLRECLEPTLRARLATLASQGGTLAPEGFIEHADTKIAYLCYTNEDYKTCVVQRPFVKEHAEAELTKALEGTARQCVNDLRDAYQSAGYTVGGNFERFTLSFTPGTMVGVVHAPLTLEKQSRRTYTSFQLTWPSEYYDLFYLATSMVEYETQMGNTDTSLYIQYYPDLSINKIQLGEGSRVYAIRNVITNESFQFATRSLVFPPGYGFAR